MKALYVTDRQAAGEAQFAAVLDAVRQTPELSVQLREHGIADREHLDLARACRAALGVSTPLYVNRRYDIALAAGADGVHLPDGGLPVARVRAHAPRGFRVGVSTHRAEDAARAIADGADLVVLGPIFATPSKSAYGSPLGPAALAGLPPRSTHSTDVYAIGGISEDNLEDLALHRDRIAGVAAVRMFQEAGDPRAVALRIARL